MSDDEGGASDTEVKEKKPKGVKRKAKKGGPKRPLSAYMFFCKEKRQEYKTANPKADFSELGKIMGSAWQGLPAGEKKPYEKQNEKDKARYEKEKEENPGTDDGDDGGKKKKAKTGSGKAKKDKDAPKNAPSAYVLFCSDERPKHPGIPFGEQGKLMGAAWKALGDDEKAPYVTKHEELKKVQGAAKAKYEEVHGKPEKKAKKKKAKGDDEDKPKKKKKAAAEADDDEGADEGGDDEGGDD